ncbi:hypothetical protein D3C77_607370 [compost metagenome]
MIRPIESIEDMGQILFGYAGTAVFNTDSGIRLLLVGQVYRFHKDSDLSSGIRIVDGIRQDVIQCLNNAGLFYRNGNKLFLGVHVH